MLQIFIPGAFLGATMMPLWWLLVAAASLVAGVYFWRSSRPGWERRSKALLMAFGSSALSGAFFLSAVWTANESCQRPPADGFCFSSGLPFLSLCALYLSIAVIGWFKWVRLNG
ncbi:MAG: hypothetical protein WBG86_06225 [Polyangiales bacterium]